MEGGRQRQAGRGRCGRRAASLSPLPPCKPPQLSHHPQCHPSFARPQPTLPSDALSLSGVPICLHPLPKPAPKIQEPLGEREGPARPEFAFLSNITSFNKLIRTCSFQRCAASFCFLCNPCGRPVSAAITPLCRRSTEADAARWRTCVAGIHSRCAVSKALSTAQCPGWDITSEYTHRTAGGAAGDKCGWTPELRGRWGRCGWWEIQDGCL